MLGLPRNTEFNRIIPKEKLFARAVKADSMRDVYESQISRIIWRNKLSNSTYLPYSAVSAGSELELIEIQTKMPALDKRILNCIDRSIPYYTFHVVSNHNMYQAWAAEKSYLNRTVRIESYHHTGWLQEQDFRFVFTGYIPTAKAVARECADWIRRKAVFKSNVTNENMGGFMTADACKESMTYMPLNGFTTVDIGCDRGNNAYNMVNSFEAPFASEYIRLFNSLWNDKEKVQDVTETIIENISTAYNENSPEFIYFVALYHVFSEFLEDISEDVLPNEATGFKQSKIWNILYGFQRDAVLAIINKLEKQIAALQAKIRKEKQFNKQMQMNNGA